MEWLIDLIICFCVIALFVFTWRFTEPHDVCRILSYVWCPTLLLAHIFIGVSHGMRGLAFLYIGVLILLSVLGTRLAKKYVRRKGVGEEREVALEGQRIHLKDRWVLFVLIFSCVLGVLNVVYLVHLAGFPMKDIFSYSQLNNLTHYIYLHDIYNKSKVVPLGMVFIYLSPFLAGVLFHQSKKRWILLCLAFIPSLFYMLLSTQKAVILFSIIHFTASYIAYGVAIKRPLHLSKVYWQRIGALGVVLFGLIAMTFLLRDKTVLREDHSTLMALPLNYSVGHVPCFDSFLSESRGGLKLGMRTFLGPSSLLGLETKLQGVYRDRLVFKTRIEGFEVGSNVYSAFRPLVEDFSVVGSLFLAFLASFCIGMVGERLPGYKRRSIQVLGIVAYTALLQYTMWSFVVSCWTYNSIIVSDVFFFVVLFLCSTKRIEGGC